MKETRIPVLCGQMLAAAMMLTSIGLAVPRLSEDIGLSLAMRGNIISAQYFGATIAVIIGGIFCDIYGKAFMTKIFMLAAALTAFLFGVIWSYPSAVIAAFALGAVTLVLENAILSSGVDLGERSRIGNSLIQTSFSVGAILIPLLFLIGLQFGQWRSVYYFLAALFVVGFFITKGSQNKERGGSFGSMVMKYGTFFKKPAYLLGPVLVLLYVAAETGLWSLAPTFFESAGSDSLTGIISSLLIWGMMLVGRIIGTALIRKTTIMRILIPFGLCGVVSFSAIIFFGGTVALFCTAVTGLMLAPFYSLLTSLATEVAGDKSSSYLAFTMGMGTLGAALVGSIAGTAGEVLGARFVILPALISFILLVIALIVFAFMNAKKASE